MMQLIAVPYSYAINTKGYQIILELKSWDDHVDIYFAGNENHTCSASEMKNRFLIRPDKEQQISFLLSAFMASRKVSLSYSCGADGFPWVVGVRVR
ncbi:hypothetical protein L4D13_07820 [Photobacterium profundum]|uniref:hypothetical protein n=1 Tax=Photobacterium profundum TaxID=74109 RepID=UPI003D150246